jgi:hypothetical protein
MSTAILTGISYGLYPISTDSCGIDSGIVVPILPRNELIDNLAKEILIFWSYGIEVRRELILRVMNEVFMHNNAHVFKEKFTSHMNLLLN